MSVIIFIALAVLFVFLLGVLVGSGQVTRAQGARDRRQAAVQRDLNTWSRGLRQMTARQAAIEEDLRWRYLEQAGLIVVDHDRYKDVPSKDQRLSRQVRRPAQ